MVEQKRNEKTMWAIVWGCAIIFAILFAIFAPEPNKRPACKNIVKECYKYFPNQRLLFGGISSAQVSCDKEHDYFIKTSYNNSFDCEPILERGYE